MLQHNYKVSKEKKRMKLFKILCTSLLVLTISIIIPSNTLFAEEENYQIMPTGITKPFSKSATIFTTYSDGVNGYEVQFSVSGTYYYGVNGQGQPFARDVVVTSCTSGRNDNHGPQDGSHKVIVTGTTYDVSYSGNSASIVVTSSVKETINGRDIYINHQHVFRLP